MAVNRDEELRIHALGAAISRRDWHAVEIAHATIRDAFHAADRLARAIPAPAPEAEARAESDRKLIETYREQWQESKDRAIYAEGELIMATRRAEFAEARLARATPVPEADEVDMLSLEFEHALQTADVLSRSEVWSAGREHPRMNGPAMAKNIKIVVAWAKAFRASEGDGVERLRAAIDGWFVTHPDTLGRREILFEGKRVEYVHGEWDEAQERMAELRWKSVLAALCRPRPDQRALEEAREDERDAIRAEAGAAMQLAHQRRDWTSRNMFAAVFDWLGEREDRAMLPADRQRARAGKTGGAEG